MIIARLTSTKHRVYLARDDLHQGLLQRLRSRDNSKKGPPPFASLSIWAVDGEYEIRIALLPPVPTGASNVRFVDTTADGDQSNDVSTNERSERQIGLVDTRHVPIHADVARRRDAVPNAGTPTGNVIADRGLQFLSADDLDKLQNPDLSETGHRPTQRVSTTHKNLSRSETTISNQTRIGTNHHQLRVAMHRRSPQRNCHRRHLHIRGEAGNSSGEDPYPRFPPSLL